MEIIDQLVVARAQGDWGPATIQLLAGDLAALPPEHAVDALVVSAFPDSYTPDPGTLFESLYVRGLDMQVVSLRKEEDERARLGCWLSAPLPEEAVARFHFQRIICFEPRFQAFRSNSGLADGNIEDAVGFVFRCLNNFIIPDRDGRRYDIRSVAMPLLATGNQSVPLEAMFPRLLQNAVFWLQEGLPIEQLKIVVFKRAQLQVAARLFHQVKSAERGRAVASTPAATAETGRPPDWRAALADRVSREVIETCTRQLRLSLTRAASDDDERAVLGRLFDRVDRDGVTAAAPAPLVPARAASDYDVFISYAHKQGAEVQALVQALQQRVPAPSVFYDRDSIPPGGQWIKLLSDAVQKARTFVAVLSPDYTASPVCWDEFQCAKLKEYNTRQSVIRTVRLYSERDLPVIMGIYSYVDCAEGDLHKLRASASILVP